MQGNQTIQLTDSEVLLSVALDCHFTDSNCDGTLIDAGFVNNNNCPAHKPIMYQFICEKCHEIIQI